MTLQIQPTAGPSTAFATIEKTGESCSIAGLYKMTGALYGQAAHTSGVESASQEVKSAKRSSSTPAKKLR